MLRQFRSRILAGALAFLAGCAAINDPINVASRNSSSGPGNSGGASDKDEVLVALAFSGGGTRASAFSHGMLEELNSNNLLRHVRFVSGVSGGSVTAAYFGLYGASGLKRYRDDYLIQDAERYMANSPANPVTLVRGISGGANDRSTFARFLDESIFKNATYADLMRRRNVRTWINASDVANNTPFLFSTETFDALCSDLSKLPVSEAVAASAAFPLVFSPIVLEAHQDCNYRAPDWLVSARHNPEATSALRAYARTLESYRDPDKIRFVKLLDGGVTDNFGTTALSMERAKAQNPYGPLSAAQAVNLRRMLFLVANAGVQQDYSWTQEVKGPGAMELAMSIANSSMHAATRVGFDVMRASMDDWHRDLIEYRCSLPEKEVIRHRGSLEGWDCADLALFVSEVSFEAMDNATRAKLDKIPTRLRLAEDQVDLAISAGRTATRRNPEFRGFLKALAGAPDLAGGAGPAPRRIAPVQN